MATPWVAAEEETSAKGKCESTSSSLTMRTNSFGLEDAFMFPSCHYCAAELLVPTGPTSRSRRRDCARGRPAQEIKMCSL